MSTEGLDKRPAGGVRCRYPKMKLTAAIERFIEERRPTASKATVAAYHSDLRYLATLARPDSVLAMNETLLTNYFMALSSQGQKMATLHRKRASVGEFVRWGVRLGLWQKNPMDGNPMFKFRRPESVPRPFTGGESTALMALPLTGAQKVFRALLYYTGLRVTPVCDLLLGNWNTTPVDLGEGLTVPGTLRAVSKGEKTTVLPVVPELHEALIEWTHERPGKRHEWLVRYPNGRPYRRRAVEHMTTEWGEATGVADCTPHRFRHTYASDLLAKGVDIRVIQRLMGHADIKSTAVYTKVHDAQAFAAVLKR